MQNLKDYEYYNIPESMIKKIEVFTENDNFQPEIIKEFSQVGSYFCAWVRGIE